ncbi:MAG: CopG family transcriptional regulator [Acidimicrobiales bacterium]
MVRTQIQLTEIQLRRLQRRAAERHVSVASLVRDAVDSSLADDQRDRLRERATAVVGRFHSGRSDVASDHDRYLEDAFGS